MARGARQLSAKPLGSSMKAQSVVVALALAACASNRITPDKASIYPAEQNPCYASCAWSPEDASCVGLPAAAAYEDDALRWIVSRAAPRVPSDVTGECFCVEFTIATSGALSNPTVIRSTSPELEDAVLKPISDIGPLPAIPKDAHCLSQQRSRLSVGNRP